MKKNEMRKGEKKFKTEGMKEHPDWKKLLIEGSRYILHSNSLVRSEGFFFLLKGKRLQVLPHVLYTSQF